MRNGPGIKIGVISGLVLVMLIPLKLIETKVFERSQFRQQAANSIAVSWTGPQTVMTPVLVIPYQWSETTQHREGSGFVFQDKIRSGQRILSADLADTTAKLSTEVLYRGIYRVPVYRAAMSFHVQVSSEKIAEAFLGITQQHPAGVSLESPYLSLQISDPRGINNLPAINWSGQQVQFQAGSKIPGRLSGVHLPLDSIGPDNVTGLDVSFDLELRGSQALHVIPAADTAQVKLSSPWRHPEFAGAFLPLEREIGERGFSARWQLNRFASQIGQRLADCEQGQCDPLVATRFGVKLIDPVDIYLQTERSTKYGILFVGLTFVCFFIVEQLLAVRIHPIQYGLVGLAIAIFFLLLLSLSEHISFPVAYLIASLVCTGLIFSYVCHVLGNVGRAGRFCGGLLALYCALYIIIQAEDVALLMGSILVFVILATVMIATRSVDWYRLGRVEIDEN